MTEKQNQISRIARSRETAKISYDRMSRRYDLIAGSSERRYTEMGLELLDAQAGEQILEIGFGTGWSILNLAQSAGNSGHVYGIDISSGMYTIASRRIEEAGLSDRVTLNCSDAIQLPYEKDKFDAIFISFTLELFDTPEIPIMLNECLRVLRQGGRLGVVSLLKTEKPGFAERLYEWFHKRFPTYIDCRPIYVSQMLKDAGFNLLNEKSLRMWGLPVSVVLVEK